MTLYRTSKLQPQTVLLLTRKLATAWLLTTLLMATAMAHHSFAPYEPEKQISFKGRVTHFQWTNPHVYMRIEGPDENGEIRNWLIECANPGILNRVGWKWNMIGEGDEITVIVAPLQNGEPGALLKAVRLADGQEFSNGGPAGPASIPFAE